MRRFRMWMLVLAAILAAGCSASIDRTPTIRSCATGAVCGAIPRGTPSRNRLPLSSPMPPALRFPRHRPESGRRPNSHFDPIGVTETVPLSWPVITAFPSAVNAMQ